MLAGLLAVGDDGQAGVFLSLDPQEGRIDLGYREIVAGGSPLRPEFARLGQPEGLGQAAGDSGVEHAMAPLRWGESHDVSARRGEGAVTGGKCVLFTQVRRGRFHAKNRREASQPDAGRKVRESTHGVRVGATSSDFHNVRTARFAGLEQPSPFLTSHRTPRSSRPD